MKKLAITLIFLLTVFAGFSQNGSANKKDTCVCVTPYEMRNAIKTQDSLVIIKAVTVVQDSLIAEMDRASKNSDSIISKLHELRLNDLKIKNNLDGQVSALTKANQLSLDYQAQLKRDLKRQKRKTRLVLGGSVTITAGLVYLLLKK